MRHDREDFDPKREFKAATNFRGDGIIWLKNSVFDKSRVDDRMLKLLYDTRRLDMMTDAEAKAVAASPLPVSDKGGNEIVNAHPALSMTLDEQAAQLVTLNVADLKAALASLDPDQLARVRAAEAAKPDDGARTTALAAIDAAIAALNPPAAPARVEPPVQTDPPLPPLAPLDPPEPVETEPAAD